MSADLSALFRDDAAALEALATLQRDAALFEERWADLSVPELDVALDEYSALHARSDELESYAGLRGVLFRDEAAHELSARIRLGLAEFSLGGFERAVYELVQAGVPDGSRWEPWLTQLVRQAELAIDPTFEAVWLAREGTAAAWHDLYHAQLATIPSHELLPGFDEPDPSKRRATLGRLHTALDEKSDIFAACYDALVADRIAYDYVHGFEDPLSATLLVDQVEEEAIASMVEQLEAAYPLYGRFYEAKRRFLGLHRMTSDALHLPWVTTEWPEESVAAFMSFSPRLGEVAQGLFDEGRVAASIGFGGARAVMASRRMPAYVVADFDPSLHSRLVLAHELGHALQFVLSLETQPQLLGRIGTASAEIAALVGEMLLFNHLADSTDGELAVAVLGAKIERYLSATLRQVMMLSFERRAYAERASAQPLTATLLSELWAEENARMLGPEIEIVEPTPLTWGYATHFFDYRCGVYAYPYACLVSLAFLRGDASSSQFEAFLSAGGSRPPAELLGLLGIGSEEESWHRGIAVMTEGVEQLERAF